MERVTEQTIDIPLSLTVSFLFQRISLSLSLCVSLSFRNERMTRKTRRAKNRIDSLSSIKTNRKENDTNTNDPKRDSMYAVEIQGISASISNVALMATLDAHLNGLIDMNVHVRRDTPTVSAALFFVTAEDAKAAMRLDNTVLAGETLRLRLLFQNASGDVEGKRKEERSKDVEEVNTKEGGIFSIQLFSSLRESSHSKTATVLTLIVVMLSLVVYRGLPDSQLSSSSSLNAVQRGTEAERSRLLLRAKQMADFAKTHVDVYSSMSVLEFEYMSDFDENGIVYHVGTGGGRWPWTNPASTGGIRVTHAPTEWSRSPVHALQRDGLVFSFTGPNDRPTADTQDGAWFKFDLGETRRIVPTHYTLRSLPTFAPTGGEVRHWVFEGSVDNEEWTVLRRHTSPWLSTWGKGDESLVRGGSASFPIRHLETLPSTAFETEAGVVANEDKDESLFALRLTSTNVFRYLRVRQIGENTSEDAKKRKALFLNGFEVYGALLESGSWK